MRNSESVAPDLDPPAGGKAVAAVAADVDATGWLSLGAVAADVDVVGTSRSKSSSICVSSSSGVSKMVTVASLSAWSLSVGAMEAMEESSEEELLLERLVLVEVVLLLLWEGFPRSS